MRKTAASALLVALLSTILVVVMPVSPSQAFVPFQCDGAGTVTVDTTGTSPAPWTLNGSGACTGAFGGPWVASLSGSGTSGSTGLCDGSVVVTNLNVDVTLTITSQSSGEVVTSNQSWSAPITTYPIATPFVVTGDDLGVGALSTRLFANCPDAGHDGARFVWAFQQGL